MRELSELPRKFEVWEARFSVVSIDVSKIYADLSLWKRFSAKSTKNEIATRSNAVIRVMILNLSGKRTLRINFKPLRIVIK